MPVPASAPEELRSVPFLGRDAVRDGLLTKNQLRSRVWTPVLRGVYVHRDLELTAAVRRQAVQLVMPKTQVACGRLAAWCHGVWSPRPGSALPLETTDRLAGNGDDRAGVNRRRLTLRASDDGLQVVYGHSDLDRDVVDLDGLLVTSPLRTCFDMMRERALVESVVVADAFAWSGLIDLTTMSVYAADRRRWPHVRQVRTALNLASAYARSPGESRLRMVVVLAGLPEPLVNVPRFEGTTGQLLGVPDLLVLGRRAVGLEYDGEYHDADEQMARDRVRERRLLTSGGLPLLRYDRTSLLHDREQIVREIAQLCGVRPQLSLVDADFRRPPRRLAW